jgi:hypothetical protein
MFPSTDSPTNATSSAAMKGAFDHDAKNITVSNHPDQEGVTIIALGVLQAD